MRKAVETIHVKPPPITQKASYNLRWLEAEGRDVNLSGIAVNSKGEIAVCDQGCDRLIILNEDGTFKETIGSSGTEKGNLSLPDGIVYNKSDHLLVSDYGNHRIQLYDCRAGKFCFSFGSGGTADGQLSFPCGLSIDEHENIIVSDWGNKRVQIFDERGNFKFKFSSQAILGKTSWGCRDSSGISEPQHCVAFKNSYFMTDGCANCVKVFDKSGTFMSNIGCMNFPQGIAVTQSEILCVCDSNNNSVQLYYLDGKPISNFPHLNWPMYLATGANGEIFVSERGISQITVLKLPY